MLQQNTRCGSPVLILHWGLTDEAVQKRFKMAVLQFVERRNKSCASCCFPLFLHLPYMVSTFVMTSIPIPYKIYVTLKSNVRNLPGGKWKHPWERVPTKTEMGASAVYLIHFCMFCDILSSRQQRKFGAGNRSGKDRVQSELNTHRNFSQVRHIHYNRSI